ncbi:MAG: RidA family protein [Acidobacteria bacterium]|nr:RidA family protein [Acidobacteriota bacterium]MCI0719657.1 RidA family protein [Acidobacteriota bacterium]
MSIGAISLTTVSLILMVAVCQQRLDADNSFLEAVEKNKETSTSFAVVVEDFPLLHTTQLLTGEDQLRKGSNEINKQVDQVFGKLETILKEMRTGIQHLVRVNVYVANLQLVQPVKRMLARKLKHVAFPATTYVVTPLPVPEALVAIDTVSVMPSAKDDHPVLSSMSENLDLAQVSVVPRGDKAYVSGQAAEGDLVSATRKTLDSLQATLAFLGLTWRDVVQFKAFFQPIARAKEVQGEIKSRYAGTLTPPIVFVEWISNQPIEIELIASARHGKRLQPQGERVSYWTPPGMTASPVFSRVAMIHGGKTVYVSGVLVKALEDQEREVRKTFSVLGNLLKRANSDFRHLVKATYYVNSMKSSQALDRIRPEFYDPSRPPAASKAIVKELPEKNSSLLLDMIAVRAH